MGHPDKQVRADEPRPGDEIAPTSYRKLPVEIQAMRWSGHNLRQMIDFTGLHPSAEKWTWDEYEQVVRTQGFKIFFLEASYIVPVGHYIIRGVKGEFYACEPSIFNLTYERATTPQSASVPHGWKLVPVEPDGNDGARGCYKAMLAAAPSHAGTPQPSSDARAVAEKCAEICVNYANAIIVEFPSGDLNTAACSMRGALKNAADQIRAYAATLPQPSSEQRFDYDSLSVVALPQDKVQPTPQDRLDWTIEDNAKKAIRIADLERELAEAEAELERRQAKIMAAPSHEGTNNAAPQVRQITEHDSSGRANSPAVAAPHSSTGTPDHRTLANAIAAIRPEWSEWNAGEASRQAWKDFVRGFQSGELVVTPRSAPERR